MSTTSYKTLFKNACDFADRNKIHKVFNNEGKLQYFEWDLDKSKYVLGKKRTPKPDFNCFFFNSGIERLPSIYTYHFVKYEVFKNTEKILNDFLGYDLFNALRENEEILKYNEIKRKLVKGYNDKGINIFNYIKEKIDHNGEHEINNDEIIAYFQDKLNFKVRYPFYRISQNKIDYIDRELKALKENNIQSKKYFDLIFESFNELYTTHLFSKDGERALNYLLSRGLSVEEIKENRLGLGFSSHWLFDGFQDKLEKIIYSKLPSEEIETYKSWTETFPAYNPYIYLGLLNQTIEGRYDSMINRITIPISNKDGNIIAFGGRDYLEVNPELPKYMITKSSINWQKSENVFGYDLAKNNLNCTNNLMIVEGFMDALALNKIGIPAIALMGVNCSNAQASLVKSLNSKDVYVSLDFDEAGESNNDKVVKQLLNCKLDSIYKFTKPDELIFKDFDEFINQKYKDISNSRKKLEINNALMYSSLGKKNDSKTIDMEI